MKTCRIRQLTERPKEPGYYVIGGMVSLLLTRVLVLV